MEMTKKKEKGRRKAKLGKSSNSQKRELQGYRSGKPGQMLHRGGGRRGPNGSEFKR